MKNPDTDRKARQRANAALAKVQHIAVEPPLPPPWSGLHHATVRTEERAEYRARLARWEETHPGYAASWGRPTVQTAEAVYALVGHLLPIPLEQIHPDPVKAKMLVTVALDAGVVAGRYGTKRSETDRIPRERQVRQHLSRMKFFDVIARRWSPTHRQVREDGKAYSVTQMREDTLHAVRRDLLLEDIAIEKLWRIVTGAWSHSLTSGNPLFHVNRSRSRTDGLNAILHDGKTLKSFERAMRQDAEYAQTRVRDGWRLWIDGEPRPPQDPHSMIVAEVPYNVVTVGPETDVVCRLQEDARLIFDAPAFVADYERLDADQRRLEKDLGASKRLRRRYGKLGAFLLEMRFVYEQARDLKKPVVIRSGFFKVMNRRYCPETFWVMEVSGKISGVLADVHPFTEWDEPEDEVSTYVLSSARSRWFSAPTRLTSRQALVHADISSSQSQIVAIFWGLRELEALAVTKRSPLKKHLAASAWEHRAVVLKPGYEEGDPRLVEAVKNLWMRIGYGSTVWTVIKDQRKDPETYGPGWTDGAKVQAWLSTIPGYDGMTAARRACQWLGNHADLYAGLEMVDPLDGARHTWNPIERADVKLRLNKWTLTPLVPGVYPTVDEDGKEIVCPICKSERIVNDADGQPIIRKGSKHRVSDEWRCGDKGHTSCRGRWRAEFRRHQPNQEGRYAIRQKKLRNQVSPCLTHSLDSLFSACVMRQLRARGVRDLASVHDCWFLAETVWKDGTQLVGHGLELLEEAIRDAGKDWLLALGPVYDALEEAFRKAIPAMLDPTKAQQIEAVEHLALVIKAREAWKARVAAEDWPHFYATGDKETLVDPPELWNDPTMPEPWDTTTS